MQVAQVTSSGTKGTEARHTQPDCGSRTAFEFKGRRRTCVLGCLEESSSLGMWSSHYPENTPRFATDSQVCPLWASEVFG